ncbi:MAG: ergothioneine biosynthesis protein EgtB [Myxococcota bacterium]
MNSEQGTWLERFEAVRGLTDRLCEPLEPEDFVIQSMDDVSPTKWHLAHTTWFFETFVLMPSVPSYTEHHPQYGYLFNSYYNTVGPMFARPRRGLLSRPTVREVFAYRAHVDGWMRRLLGGEWGTPDNALTQVVEIGLHHEQQHQELLVTDIKHVLSCNPLSPIYRPHKALSGDIPQRFWVEFSEDLYRIGYDGDGFAFDNESPRHRVFLPSFALSSRLVTNGEYLEFMRDGGYERFALWLSEGWSIVQEQGWKAPLYWFERDGEWWSMTLGGPRPIDMREPVCHVSYFEADAYARWAEARLPTEAEWEVAAAQATSSGNFVEEGHYHPIPAVDAGGGGLRQMFGDVWEWTASPYVAYPGYAPLEGALGEYNGKFMCNQMVLRGGSCATSQTHIRPTYRNFFPTHSRWQFMGIRLAQDRR